MLGPSAQQNERSSNRRTPELRQHVFQTPLFPRAESTSPDPHPLAFQQSEQSADTRRHWTMSGSFAGTPQANGRPLFVRLRPHQSKEQLHRRNASEPAAGSR